MVFKGLNQILRGNMQGSLLALIFKPKSIAGRPFTNFLQVKVYFSNGHHHSFRLISQVLLAIVRILMHSAMLLQTPQKVRWVKVDQDRLQTTNCRHTTLFCDGRWCHNSQPCVNSLLNAIYFPKYDYFHSTKILLKL